MAASTPNGNLDVHRQIFFARLAAMVGALV
jgi:hypothetical protein